MLRLARSGALHGGRTFASLLDRVDLVARETRMGCGIGWTPASRQGCVRLAGKPDEALWDVVLANLFIHHFASRELVDCWRGSQRGHVCSCAASRGAPPSRWRAAA
jgi:hypothetical protein